MEHSMDVPRRPGQRPARLPTRPQPQLQPQHQQSQAPPQQSPQSSGGSSGSMHRRQHSPYVHPFFLPPPHPPPFFSYHYPYTYPIYPYPPIYPGALPPPPPPPPQPLSANRPMSQQFQRPRETHQHRQQESQSPGIRLNEILRASQSPPALVWLISHRPSFAQSRRSEAHYSPVESLAPSTLSQAATDPPVHHMNIVSNEFTWEIIIEVRPPAFITVETVLFGIYAIMQHGLTPAEWEAIEEPNIKRNAHWTRCARLAKGDSHLAFDGEYSAIKRVDLLGDKVAFRGLVPLSNSGSRCVEFLIQLGSTQSNDKKLRMRRGSF